MMRWGNHPLPLLPRQVALNKLSTQIKEAEMGEAQMARAQMGEAQTRNPKSCHLHCLRFPTERCHMRFVEFVLIEVDGGGWDG